MSLLRPPWTSQPQQPVGIDWGNPITQGLEWYWTPIDSGPIVFNKPSNPVSAVRGVAQKFRTSVSDNIQGDRATLTPTAQGTVFALMISGPGTAAAGVVCRSSGVGALGIRTGTGLVYAIAAAQAVGPSISLGANTLAFVAARNNPGNTGTIYCNGVFASAALTITAPSSAPAIGFTASGQNADHTVFLAGSFSRALSDAEIASLGANPWQLFAPSQRRIWVPTAAATGNQTLTPALFTNSSTFYSAVVSQAGVAQSLTPSLYTNTNAFYPATVTPGAVSLAPSLFTNSGTFYSATVSLGGSPQTLTPALFTNPQSFSAPTVSPGAVNLAPALFTNAQTFYAPVVTNGVTLAPPLLTNSQTFYGASITLGPAVLRPALLANVNQFYTHALTGGVVRIKQKGLRKTRYTPGRVPSDAKELARFIQNELERLTDALESPFTHQLLEVLHAEPSRKSGEAAMVAYADGTDWNPGAGRGLYLYDPQTAAWTKL